MIANFRETVSVNRHREFVDQEYVAAVEAAANRSTVQNRIIWVNPPTEEVTDNGASKTQH